MKVAIVFILGIVCGYILHGLANFVSDSTQHITTLSEFDGLQVQPDSTDASQSKQYIPQTNTTPTISIPPVDTNVEPTQNADKNSPNAPSSQLLVHTTTIMGDAKRFIAQQNYTQAFPLLEELLFQMQEVYTQTQLEKLFVSTVSAQKELLQGDLVAQMELLNYAMNTLPEYKGFTYDMAQIYLTLGELENAKYYANLISYDVNWREKATKLQDAINYQELFMSGEIQIPLIPKNNAWHIQVNIDGKLAVLILDTGATTTVVRESLLPIGYTKLKKVIVSTANGQTDAYTSKVELAIALITHAEFEVLVLEGDKLPKGIDGLLGVDFLNKYHFIIDKTNNMLQLSPLS